MPANNQITRAEAVQQVADTLDGPVAINDFIDRVLQIYPSKAKKPQTGIRSVINQDFAGRNLVFLDSETILPTRLILPGFSFWSPLSSEEVRKGFLFVYPTFRYLHPNDLDVTSLQFEEMDGHSIPTEMRLHTSTVNSPLGPYSRKVDVFDLKWWYKKNKVQQNNYLLVTIADWVNGRYTLQIKNRKEYGQQQDDTQKSNQIIADILFDLLENSRTESLWGTQAIITACARFKSQYPNLPPPDHWLLILEEDPRMFFDHTFIRYAEDRRFNIFSDEAKPEEKSDDLSPEDEAQVYRFKAFFKYNKSIWRRIEIQGGHTMDDFDGILRQAFHHDTSDHLSGFWKLIRRGKSRRFREVDIATIYPFGDEGENQYQPIAALDLKPDDKLKYVYDFGDWIDHRLELEAVEASVEGVKYPRIVAQNKPRYQYCLHCKEKGEKTIATSFCYTCSNRENNEVVVCNDCLIEFHETHYIEEMIY